MNIKILPYNTSWTEDYKEASLSIKNILGDLLVDVYHVGSTAVQGLSSRPIIDIMAVVKDIGIIEDYEDIFENFGYECLGEFGLPGRRHYRKGINGIAYHLDIFDIYNDKEIIRFLAFRDYLRAHPEEASFYGELKQALALQFPEDLEGYAIGKSVFIDKLEKKAVEWYINKFSVNGDI